MGEIIKMKAADIFPLISEIISRGQGAQITVVGSSMYPFLRDGIDSVELNKCRFESLSRGDIVMIRRTSGTYIMHRIIKKNKNCFFIIGDVQQWIEGPLFPDQLVASVTAVWRKNRRISCTNRLWRFLSELWLLLRPYRNIVLKIIRAIQKLLNDFKFLIRSHVS